MLLTVSGMLYVWYVPPTVYPIVMWTDYSTQGCEEASREVPAYIRLSDPGLVP